MARVAILVEKIYEDLELQYPRLRLKEAGHTVDVIGPKAGEIYIGKHGYPQKADLSASDVKAADYALTPGRYVGSAEITEDGEPIDQKIKRLSMELLAAFDESARLEKLVRKQLERLHG